MNIDTQAKQILNELTTEEKVKLTIGNGVWYTHDAQRLGLNSIMMTDGPHGLRKQADCREHMDLGYSNPAVCFPTASKLACSWDRQLLSKVGNALANQCLAEDVSIILGPGINIKRNSLCGRNFEYFSEDPYLTSQLATHYINAVQSNNIGVSLKHFCANNQEYARMICDSIIDDRTLNELYLSAFRDTIKASNPYTIMCSYNIVNGDYASQNKKLLTDILRTDWQYNGTVVSDWGAVSDRPSSIKAGLDLQMPGDDYVSTLKAIEDKSLAMEDIDKAALNVIKLILKCSQPKAKATIDNNEQHQLAITASSSSTVMAKNTCNMLPLTNTQNIAVIGALAKDPHYQGGGSSRVNSTEVSTLITAMDASNISYTYAPGYQLDTTMPNQQLIDEAVVVAQNADTVLLVVGLPDICEIEGFDRNNLDMPSSITTLIDAVTTANANVIAVVQSGAPVNMQWDTQVKAVLLDYMAGQGGGQALLDIILGNVNPSGKLAETWPLTADKQSSSNNFANNKHQCMYAESIFVGYRYYDYAPENVKYPFGYGLSYTTFELKNSKLSSQSVNVGDKLTVSVDIKNTGAQNGQEVVQVYVTSLDNKQFMPAKELKAFAKVSIDKNETVTAKIELDTATLAYYNIDKKALVVDGGQYQVHVATSSQNILATLPLTIVGENTSVSYKETLPHYYNIDCNWKGETEQFKTLLNRPIPEIIPTKKGNFTVDSTAEDVRNTLLGRVLYNVAVKSVINAATNAIEKEMLEKSIPLSPLRTLAWQPNFSREVIDGLIMALNGKLISGTHKALKAYKANEKRIKQQQEETK